MNVIREIARINETELDSGIVAGVTGGSWHESYRHSAWVFLGGLSSELSEGDIICIMSQYGEVEDINLVRDKSSGEGKGFCFIKYEDQRSTILAVDNVNGINVLDRTIRCDHIDKYKMPREVLDREEALLTEDPSKAVALGPGHAYRDMKHADNTFDMAAGVDLFSRGIDKVLLKQQRGDETRETREHDDERKAKKKKEKKKEKKEKMERRKRDRVSESVDVSATKRIRE